MIRRMPFKLPLILSIVSAVFKDRADLVAENIALRAINFRASLIEGPAPGFVPSIVSSGCCSLASGLAGGKVWRW